MELEGRGSAAFMDAMKAQMLTLDQPEMKWQMAREKGDTTFSQEAMEQLSVMMTAWVTSRMLRRWGETREAPYSMVVTVNVEFEED